jgi:glycosyltransferase involved in cell wall biosynthesis
VLAVPTALQISCHALILRARKCRVLPMRIAFYIPTLQHIAPVDAAAADFIQETVHRVVTAHSDHEFLLCGEALSGEGFADLPRITWDPLPGALWRFHRQLNRHIDQLYRTEKIDLLVSMTGYAGTRRPGPTCLVLTGLSDNSGRETEVRYRRKYAAAYLKQAGTVATCSRSQADQLAARFGLGTERLHAVGRGVAPGLGPLSWEERETVKAEFTDGREYFMGVGPIRSDGRFIALLKAFSVLKKRFRSGMMLLWAGPLAEDFPDFPRLLATYHFKDDVLWLPEATADETERLIGAAYALVSPDPERAFCTGIGEALATGVPVLTAAGPQAEEAAGDAALYFDPANSQQAGELFCDIYKQESLRGRLIAQAAHPLEKFDWDRTAALLWSAMEGALQAEK